MTLTSCYPNPTVLELCDGRQTMSVALREVPELWRILAQTAPVAGQPAVTWAFTSDGVSAYNQRLRRPMFTPTRHVVRYDAAGVIWQLFYELPHVGQVRKEVCWSRGEVVAALRAAVVASKLSGRAQSQPSVEALARVYRACTQP